MTEALFNLVERDGWRFVVRKKMTHSIKPRELVDPLIVTENEELQSVPKRIERLERLVNQKPNPRTAKPKFKFDRYGQGLLPFDVEVIDNYQGKNSRDVIQENPNRVNKSKFQMKLLYKKPRVTVADAKSQENPISKYLEEHGVGYYVMQLKPAYKFDMAKLHIRNFGRNPPDAGFLVQRFEGRYTGIRRANSFQFKVLNHLCDISYKAIQNIRYYSKDQVGVFWSRLSR